MNVERLLEEARARGLTVLAVTEHPTDPQVATIFLHGAKGDWVEGHAQRVISSIPGVRAARENIRTPAIILAWMEPDDSLPPAQTSSAPAGPSAPVFRPRAFVTQRAQSLHVWPQ